MAKKPMFEVSEIYPGVILEKQRVGSTYKWNVYMERPEHAFKSFWYKREALAYAAKFDAHQAQKNPAGD